MFNTLQKVKRIVKTGKFDVNRSETRTKDLINVFNRHDPLLSTAWFHWLDLLGNSLGFPVNSLYTLSLCLVHGVITENYNHAAHMRKNIIINKLFNFLFHHPPIPDSS